MEIDLLMLVDYACLLGGVRRGQGGRSCQALPNPCKHDPPSPALAGSALRADLVLLRRTAPVARAASLLLRCGVPAATAQQRRKEIKDAKGMICRNTGTKYGRMNASDRGRPAQQDEVCVKRRPGHDKGRRTVLARVRGRLLWPSAPIAACQVHAIITRKQDGSPLQAASRTASLQLSSQKKARFPFPVSRKCGAYFPLTSR